MAKTTHVGGDNRERVHSLFRGAAEFGKRLRAFAFLIEVATGVGAVVGVFTESGPGAIWWPLLSFILIGVARVLRVWASRVARFAEVCRRESAVAYALGLTISPARMTTLCSDAPPWAERIAARLPASTLAEYYEPECPEGEARLREIYANSSFHTWRLLRSWSYVLGITASILFISTLCIMYWLASAEGQMDGRLDIINALFTIALAIIAVQVLESLFNSIASYRTTRNITDSLLRQPLPSGEALLSLVREYDSERTDAPPVPTRIYKWKREKLSEDWDECKKEFGC